MSSNHNLQLKGEQQRKCVQMYPSTVNLDKETHKKTDSMERSHLLKHGP